MKPFQPRVALFVASVMAVPIVLPAAKQTAHAAEKASKHPKAQRTYPPPVINWKGIKAPAPYDLAADAAAIAKNGGHSTAAQTQKAILAATLVFKSTTRLVGTTTRDYSEALKRKGVKQDMVPVLNGLTAYVPKPSKGADFFTAMNQYFQARTHHKTHAESLLAAKSSCNR